VRHFGQQIANSQGLAIFSITVPQLGIGMILTATATNANGNQVKSEQKPIKIID